MLYRLAEQKREEIPVQLSNYEDRCKLLINTTTNEPKRKECKKLLWKTELMT